MPRKLERDLNPRSPQPPLTRVLDLCSPEEGGAPGAAAAAAAAHLATGLSPPPAVPLSRALQLQDPPPSQAGQVLGDIRAGLPPGDVTWPRPALDRGGSRT